MKKATHIVELESSWGQCWTVAVCDDCGHYIKHFRAKEGARAGTAINSKGSENVLVQSFPQAGTVSSLPEKT